MALQSHRVHWPSHGRSRQHGPLVHRHGLCKWHGRVAVGTATWCPFRVTAGHPWGESTAHSAQRRNTGHAVPSVAQSHGRLPVHWVTRNAPFLPQSCHSTGVHSPILMAHGSPSRLSKLRPAPNQYALCAPRGLHAPQGAAPNAACGVWQLHPMAPEKHSAIYELLEHPPALYLRDSSVANRSSHRSHSSWPITGFCSV